eukprot:scaffold35110_cov53-Cyclotella_meneghiniana.AAC.6
MVMAAVPNRAAFILRNPHERHKRRCDNDKKYITSNPTIIIHRMALTDEFLQIKEQHGGNTDPNNNNNVNPTITNNNDSIINNNENNESNNKYDLGSFALNKVKRLARSTGISERFGGSSRSSREEFIKWQRNNLRHVRREVALGRIGDDADTGNNFNYYEDSNDNHVRGSSSSSNTREVLIKALPSNNNNKTPPARRTESDNNDNNNNNNPTTITTALQTLERDMTILDNLASSQSQLSLPEVGLLLGAVTASGIGPIVFPGTSVTEVLAPAAAAFTASITIGSEYIGRVAVADGKEIAANAIQCAAEAEAFLANAERVKAITPLCVGLGATCASFALLTPTLVEVLNLSSVQMITQIYLLCPLIAILSAAVANLALEETRDFSSRAINVGVRRFSKGGDVGRTWLSSAEQVKRNSQSKTERWWSFAGSVLPAPIIGGFFGPPALSAKCIVIAALAAAQSAYFLALAEGVIARAQDAVAIKARSAAVCDT